MEVELTIDGEKVIMNDFVQKILGNMLGGAVETLHGVEGGWSDVSIKIKQ